MDGGRAATRAEHAAYLGHDILGQQHAVHAHAFQRIEAQQRRDVVAPGVGRHPNQQRHDVPHDLVGDAVDLPLPIHRRRGCLGLGGHGRFHHGCARVQQSAGSYTMRQESVVPKVVDDGSKLTRRPDVDQRFDDRHQRVRNLASSGGRG
jgi:hypothetical protein